MHKSEITFPSNWTNTLLKELLFLGLVFAKKKSEFLPGYYNYSSSWAKPMISYAKPFFCMRHERVQSIVKGLGPTLEEDGVYTL